jgi:hypothetical protein
MRVAGLATTYPRRAEPRQNSLNACPPNSIASKPFDPQLTLANTASFQGISFSAIKFSLTGCRKITLMIDSTIKAGLI